MTQVEKQTLNGFKDFVISQGKKGIKWFKKVTCRRKASILWKNPKTGLWEAYKVSIIIDDEVQQKVEEMKRKYAKDEITDINQIYNAPWASVEYRNGGQFLQKDMRFNEFDYNAAWRFDHGQMLPFNYFMRNVPAGWGEKMSDLSDAFIVSDSLAKEFINLQAKGKDPMKEHGYKFLPEDYKIKVPSRIFDYECMKLINKDRIASAKYKRADMPTVENTINRGNPRLNQIETIDELELSDEEKDTVQDQGLTL